MVRTLVSNPSSPGLNLQAAINRHPGVPQVGRGINVSTASRKDIELEDPSASTGRPSVDDKDPTGVFHKESASYLRHSE